MIKSKNSIIIPIIVLVSYLIMITTNSLANILPINGKGTGEISDSYPNLFAPAGITFAIWGVIYLLLLIYSVYQLLKYKKETESQKTIFKNIGIWFSASSIANTLWIFAWHYKVIWLSLLLILVVLTCLIKINIILKNNDFPMLEQFTVKLPFTVYFGWITVATIANATTFLVSIHWNRFTLSEVFWTNFVLGIGALIGIIVGQTYKTFAYGLVLIWAYSGIALKHLSPEQFNGRYPSVIITVCISILLIVLSQISLLRGIDKKNLFKSNQPNP